MHEPILNLAMALLQSIFQQVDRNNARKIVYPGGWACDAHMVVKREAAPELISAG